MSHSIMTPNGQPLRPGFQIYNGRLIEVRPASTFQILPNQANHNHHQRMSQSSNQATYGQKTQQQSIASNSVGASNTNHQPIAKRPGWDVSAFDRKKNDIIKEVKKEFQEKLIKKKPLKATKLIWDPIGEKIVYILHPIRLFCIFSCTSVFSDFKYLYAYFSKSSAFSNLL